MAQAPLYSTVEYDGDGQTNTFSVPFSYLDKSHVIVKVNDVPMQFAWLTDSSIQITDPAVGSAPASGSVVRISRSTPRGKRMVAWQAGSTLTSHDMNLNALQQFYIEQELWDSFLLSLGGVLGNFGTGTDGAPSTIDPTNLLDNTIQNVLNSTLLSDLDAKITDIDTNAQSISSHAGLINSLQNSVGVNATAITTEQTQRSDGDTQLANLIALIGAKNSTGSAFIIDTSTAMVDSTTSLADKFSSLSSSIGSNTASITNETNARTSQYNTLSQQINTLSAQSSTFYVQSTAPTNPNVGDVWYDSSNGNHPYRWDGTQWVDVQDQTLTTLKSEISTEQTARINGDNANAQSIQTLQTTVDGNTSSIQTNAQSINGMSAEYYVKTDVNGYVAGYGIYSSGAQSQFIVLADKFSVVTPTTTWTSGWTPTVGQFAKATSKTSYIFKAVGVTGPTGSNEPTWPTTLNGQVVDGGVTWQAVSPNSQVPFIVGNINGTDGVGITGNLIVDGSIYGRSIKFGEITAQHLNVNSLSAITADIGTVTAGTLKTAAGTGQRLEISSSGSWPLWYGTGTKNAANGKFYLDTSGNAYFSGNVQATTINGSVIDPWTLRLDTGGGRRAAVQVYNSANYNGANTSVTLNLGSITSPDYGSGLDPFRVVDRRMDTFFDININGDGGNEEVELQVKYDNGAWITITTETADLNYRGSMTLKGRYTLDDSTAWNKVYFQVITTKNHTSNAAAAFVINNFGKSGNAAGSTSFGTSGSSGTGVNPQPPSGGWTP